MLELHPAQQRVLASRARFVSAVSGSRGGKTVVGARAFCARLHEDLARAHREGRFFRPVATGKPIPLLRYWVVAPTYDLASEAQEQLSGLFANYRWAPRWQDKYKDIFHTCWLGNKGVLVQFRSAEDPNKLVSKRLDGLWVDEASRMKGSAWTGNLRQRLADRQGWALFTSTPLGPNWFFSEVFQPGAPVSSKWYDPTKSNAAYEAHHWFTRDNPHPGVRADDALAKETLPKRMYEREFCGSFDAYSGMVYEDLDQSLIREWTGGAFDRVFGGVDFGHGAPGAIVVVGARQGRNGVAYHAIDEHHSARMSTHEWTQRAAQLCSRHNALDLYADPAGAQQIRDWSDAGLPMRTHRRINDVSAGVRVVASLLKQGRLTVSPRCVNLIRELRAYRYREDSAGNSTDQVVKENDHACFPAGTPVLTPSGPRPIETVARGAAVLSLDPETQQWTTRLALGGLTSPLADTVEVVTERGAVRCTPDHPFLTTEGWRRADALAGQTLLADPSAADDRDTPARRGHVPSADPKGALCELAQTRPDALPVAFVRVLAVRSAGRAPVYGLTVMGTRNYVAAGFVVANCDALRYGVFADHLLHDALRSAA